MVLLLELQLLSAHGAKAGDITINIPPGSTEGEVLDAISRMTCEAYRVLRQELEKSS